MNSSTIESGKPPKPAGETRVLVTFASRFGSTRGIAERVAVRIAEQGASVEVRPVDEAGNLSAYDAIVLGSAVFGQSWIPAATELVRNNRQALAQRQVWLFSVGSISDRHRLWGRFATREPKEIGELQAAVHPRDYRVFAGIIVRDRWPFFSRLFFRALGGRFGDNRDWPEIESWADGIGRTMAPSSGPRPPRS